MAKLRNEILKRFPKLKILKDRITPGSSLSQQAVFGIGWMSALRILNQLLGLARLTILARLLSPGDFGLFGIAMLTISILDSLSFSGFRTAIIQRIEVTKSILNTAWTVHVIRGLLLSVVLFVISPLVANFYNEPDVIWLLRVLSISVLIQGFENIGVVFFQKDLEFQKDFTFQFVSLFADITISLLFAYLLRSVWALIFGLIARRLIQIIASYALHPYRPIFRITRRDFRELFSFGKWSSLSVILHFGYTQGDDIFVGKILGSTSLGLYQMAYKYSKLAVVELTSIISNITVPTYSKLQNDKVNLRKAYHQTQKLLGYISAPLAAGTAVIAPDFVRLFLGEQWIPMVPALQILTVIGFVSGINSNIGPLVVAIGRPDLGTWMNLGRLGFLAILIYPASQWWGIIGVSSVIALVTISFVPISFSLAKRYTGISIKNLLFETAVPLFMTTIMVIIVEIFRYFVLTPIGFIDLGILILIGGLTYLLLTLLVDKILNYGVVDLFMIYFNKLKKEGR